MVKSASVFVVMLVSALTSADYAHRHEDFDVDAVLAKDSAIEAYIHCFLGSAQCDPLAADVRDTILEAFEDGCAKCSPQQINNLQRAFAFVNLYKRDYLDQIISTLDPKRKASHIYELQALKYIKNLPIPIIEY